MSPSTSPGPRNSFGIYLEKTRGLEFRSGALVSFVVAGFAAKLMAEWLFGSSNFLALVIATLVGAGAYLAILRRDRRVS